MPTEAQKKAKARYDAKNYLQFVMRFNKKTDADILQFLEGLDNKRDFILKLIRKDIGTYVN
jgi:hypothetical protein